MIDCSKARPAGKLFNYNGKTIRPSQNCTNHYGQEIYLENILEISDSKFITEFHSTIIPLDKSNYNKGIHTINSDANITVIDGKRFIFTISGLKQQLKQKIRK